MTFTISWVDPVSSAVSVKFSDNANEWVVPVDFAQPDTWEQAISDWYSRIAPWTQQAVNPFAGKVFVPESI